MYTKLKKYFDIDTIERAIKYRMKKGKILAFKYCNNYIEKKIKIKTYSDNIILIEDRIKKLFPNCDNIANIISEDEKKIIFNDGDKNFTKKFSILNREVIFENDIDWSKDYVSNYSWDPGTFYQKYKIINMENSADVKFPWELSRCHHLIRLVQLFLLTSNEKYINFSIGQILDWIIKNPFMKSINWTCAMDVSIRSINWIWILNICVHKNKIDKGSLKKILNSLYQHGFYIYHNQEKNSTNNHNHYLSNLIGLIFLGIIFEKKSWKEYAIYELYREIRTQILPSGPSYERSINYHRLVVEIILLSLIVIKRFGYEVPSDIEYRLEKMFEFVMYYTKPNGQAPVIGDQDDGRLLPLGVSENINHRYLLCLGAIYYARNDFATYAEKYSIDAYFIYGNESLNIFENLKIQKKITLKSKKFHDAGFYIIRNKDDYMFINNSGKGRYPELGGGTHTHSDLLSFDLVMKNENVFIDSGTGVYSSDIALRKKFRTTKMHNTVMIDNKNQNKIDKYNLWDFERNAIPNFNNWFDNESFSFFDGEHSGYERFKNPVNHRRCVLYSKQNREWRIFDFLKGKGFHSFEWNFHFGINMIKKISENVIDATITEEMKFRIIFLTDQKIKVSLYKDLTSSAYGVIKQNKVGKVNMFSTCPLFLLTKIKILGS